eukprot:14753785-Heterocapsa_arctica.AAC.1
MTRYSSQFRAIHASRDEQASYELCSFKRPYRHGADTRGSSCDTADPVPQDLDSFWTSEGGVHSEVPSRERYLEILLEGGFECRFDDFLRV